jgi:MerR family transcriptional regulator, light-induced transcriptional regulator
LGRAVKDPLLRIGELSRRTGLSTDVIRAWERRYDLLQPRRTDGGFRLYGADDLSRLRLMQHFLGKGLPAAQAAGLVHRVQTAAFDTNPGVPDADARHALQVLRTSLEAFDDGPAERVLERLLGICAPGAVLRDVVLPYLTEVGERWARGEASVAQEHFASSFLQGWLLTMARGWNQSGGRRALLACVPGERHVLGLIAFGLALNDLGWRITYLGADAPLDAVDRAAGAVDADVVVLAATLPETLAAALDDLRALAERHAVAVGGAAAVGNGVPWLSGRTLPADPLVAAQALESHAAGPPPLAGTRAQ